MRRIDGKDRFKLQDVGVELLGTEWVVLLWIVQFQGLFGSGWVMSGAIGGLCT